MIPGGQSPISQLATRPRVNPLTLSLCPAKAGRGEDTQEDCTYGSNPWREHGGHRAKRGADLKTKVFTGGIIAMQSARSEHSFPLLSGLLG
jgi:hypothetical protein